MTIKEAIAKILKTGSVRIRRTDIVIVPIGDGYTVRKTWDGQRQYLDAGETLEGAQQLAKQIIISELLPWNRSCDMDKINRILAKTEG